jgi:hypothetical protein
MSFHHSCCVFAGCRGILKFILILCLLLPAVFLAQDRAVSSLQETGLWNGVYFKARFNEKTGYYAEHHLRFRNSGSNLYDFAGRFRQVYNRVGLNLFLSPNFEAVIGPALVFNFTPDPANDLYKKVTLEPRIWHQWLFSMEPIWRFKIYHQFRFEHRWKRDNEYNTVHDYTNRYRYKIFAYVPLNKKKIGVGTLFFSPSAEIFMHSGRSIVYHPFEDFRTYNGIGYILSERFTLFGGHMWTFGQKVSGFEYASSHIFRLNVFIGLDFRHLENKLPTINIGY